MNELALFAGAGGGILGGKLLGWRTVCAVEWEQYPASVLCARQNDGLLPPFPIWDDVRTFNGRPWRGIVDVVSGGFPCQDISAAGKGAGIDGERSGMWREMARIIHEVRPRYALVENSPMLTSRGLGTVLGDLAEMGFDARWGVLGAADVGANHQRDRIWIVATNTRYGEQRQQESFVRQECSKSIGKEFGNLCENISNAHSAQRERGRFSVGAQPQYADFECSSWWQSEPNLGRVANGVAARVDRLKAIGNGQVPLCAATAWRFLTGR
jgi:DNA (cytosine-5)-methyltransferase 1